MFIDETQLREFVRDSGLVSRADFEVAAKEADAGKASVGGLLVEKGKISPDDLRKMQAYILGVPFVDLSSEKIAFEILSLIPEPISTFTPLSSSAFFGGFFCQCRSSIVRERSGRFCHTCATRSSSNSGAPPSSL